MVVLLWWCAVIAFSIVLIESCDVTFDQEYAISNKQLSNSIIFDNHNETIIQFELKLDNNCNDRCNILEIAGDKDAVIQFTIEGQQNYLKITSTNNDNIKEDILIPNANQLLPSDNQYHAINITFTPNSKTITIDNIIYYQSIISNHDNYKPILLSSTETRSLYINNPPSSSSIGYIKNICIVCRATNISSLPTTTTITANQMNTTNSSSVDGFNYVFIEEQMSWFRAEIFCEKNYNTHLATIITDSDLQEALEILRKADYENNDVWIGMYDILNEGKWIWIDETSCEYAPNKQCINDNHWASDEPNNYQLESHCARIDASEITPDLTVFSDTNCDSQNKYNSFLCNAPNGAYGGITDCADIMDCWQESKYINNSVLNEDLSDMNAAIAYWNGTLFIVGNEEMHYSKFELFNDDYDWQHVPYDTVYSWNANMRSQQYTQYQSSLYLLVDNLNDSSPYLLHFDLNTLEMTANKPMIAMDPDYAQSACLVTDGLSVYFIVDNSLIEYKCFIGWYDKY